LNTNFELEYATVDVGSAELFNYPFVHMTGHGNVIFSDGEAENLRNYLISGGFLHIDDNYGMDEFARLAMKKVFPENDFVELPFQHEVYHQKYDFDNGLPKIHKANVPLRPIVSCRGTPLYNTAKLVARVIKPLVGKSSHHVENSQDLIKKLRNVNVSDNEIMASFDVTALFTNVPIKESIEIIRQRLMEDTTLKDRTNLTVAQITQLLECCLTTTYFFCLTESFTHNLKGQLWVHLLAPWWPIYLWRTLSLRLSRLSSAM
jgi:hypothetical protein